jgi:hypothetical protein
LKFQLKCEKASALEFLQARAERERNNGRKREEIDIVRER